MCTLKREAISGKSCKSNEKCFLFHFKMIDPESYQKPVKHLRWKRLFLLFLYISPEEALKKL